MEKYCTAKYFIEKFEKIPEELWCTSVFGMGEKHCALGHCGTYKNIVSWYDTTNIESNALVDLFNKYLHKHPINVNDKTYKGFKHPRRRILAALKDMPKNARVAVK